MNATKTKTLEQLREEAQAADAALRAAQEELVKKERAAKEEVEREAREKKAREQNQKMAGKLKPIYDALQAADVNCTFTDLCVRIGSVFSADDADVRVGVESKWHCGSPTGGYNVTLGECYANMTRIRYPQLKNGGHSTDKIVATIKDRLEIKAAQVKTKQQEQTVAQKAEQLAATVRAELGFTKDEIITSKIEYSYPKGSGGRYEYSTHVAPPGKVYVKVGNLCCTPEQAKIITDALKASRKLEPKKEAS